MNEEKFSGRAQTYQRYRPGYPAVLMDELARRCALDENSVIADLGAGTGIFSGLLARQGWRVRAVEPNPDMRAAAVRELAVFEKVTVSEGSAEATGLEDASVELVTAAQAFHWFDRARCKAECKRILKPGGMAALIWNHRVADSELVRETDGIIRRFCPDFKGFSGGTRGGGDPGDYDDFFAGRCEMRVFPFDIPYDRDGFIGRNLSGSYAPKPGETAFEPYVAALGALFDRRQTDGRLVLPNTTQLFLGRV